MKTVSELQAGDVVIVDGIEFIIKVVANLPDGKTTILFEDMPATRENMNAYGKLLTIMKEANEKNDERTD